MIVALPPGFTALSQMRLYSNEARTGAPVDVPVTNTGGVWTADVSQVTPGRYYPSLVGIRNAVPGTAINVALVDLPIDDRLVLSPEALAVKAGVPLPLTEERREVIVDAILDAQADVYAYLGRPVMPQTYVEQHVWPHGETWELTEHGDDDIVGVTSAVPETYLDGQPSGYFTVTYVAGMNCRDSDEYRPIKRYVIAHAMNSPEFTRMWKVATNAKGDVKSVSAEGQSVSFSTPTLGASGTSKPGDGSPGALPTLASLDKWRVAGRRVHQARTRAPQAYTIDGWR